MTETGWRYGPVFDPSTRTHDALVPFERLAPHDARSTRVGVLAAEIEHQLVDLVAYPRGADREITAAEMRVGLGVEDSHTGEAGEVRSWTLDAGGALDSIIVRWTDGGETAVFPPERTIRLKHD